MRSAGGQRRRDENPPTKSYRRECRHSQALLRLLRPGAECSRPGPEGKVPPVAARQLDGARLYLRCEDGQVERGARLAAAPYQAHITTCGPGGSNLESL